MKISDLIESFIINSLGEEEAIELKRNELANTLGCVPSQINYVISTRFTNERGYIVESKRGGGGYIKISKVTVPEGDIFMHIVNTIGQTIDAETICAILNNLISDRIITKETGRIIMAACSDSALGIVQNMHARNTLRANIFKKIIMCLI